MFSPEAYLKLKGDAPDGTTLGTVSADVNAMKSIGRYLSVWDCATGLPQTDPTTMPYTYQTGDYYRVGTVSSGGTNYKPSGTTYTGAASTEAETKAVEASDLYIYDGTHWTLLKSTVLRELAETWTFTLANGTTVTKKVVVLP